MKCVHARACVRGQLVRVDSLLPPLRPGKELRLPRLVAITYIHGHLIGRPP